MTTGPNTPEGKAAVAANALKHGLRSSKIVLPEVESEEEWDEFREGILESLKPVGRLEEELALRVAQLSWRLRRALRAEHDAVIAGEPGANDMWVAVAEMCRQFSGITGEPPPPPPESGSRNQPPPNLPPLAELQKIMRYEAQYTRQLFQTLHALQALQSQRNGKAVPLIRVQWH